ncbi:MAG TPA: CaiB/BaiF CoA-transferase family protein, partial [Bryobacteraceae bacterium]
MKGPLSGIVVLDLTRLLPGAVATQQLADWGAEVIKIEQPGAGDYARTMNPAVFARTNSGKKSVAIDLKQTRGREVLLALARHADVLIEGFRPGVMMRLGLSFEKLHAANERLIYVSLTGYGQAGPFANLAGHDVNYMALGGVLS